MSAQKEELDDDTVVVDSIEKEVDFGGPEDEVSVSGEENYDLLRMTQNIHSLLLSMVNRNMHAESEVKKASERLRSLEYNVDTAKATFESVNKIAESIAEGRQKPIGFPVTQNQ